MTGEASGTGTDLDAKQGRRRVLVDSRQTTHLWAIVYQ
jgi:hypothetical protein